MRARGQVIRGLHTLAAEASISGIALHSGLASNVRLKPALAEAGIHFVRTDHIDSQGVKRIAARPSNVTATVLSTTIGIDGESSVGTIEHLMAALCGMGIGACCVEVDAPELPVLDGSAAPWVAAIRKAGVAIADSRIGAAGSAGSECHPPADGVVARQPAVLRSTVWVSEGDAWAVAVPSRSPKLTVGIEFPDHPPIGRQWASWAPPQDAWRAALGHCSAEHADRGEAGEVGVVGTSAATAAAASSSSPPPSFAAAVAPARTFALAEQIAYLRERGLIKGGSLENALVCDANGWLNPAPSGNDTPLRFPNEPARHKLLDLMGDLALLGGGGLPRAHITAFKAGHQLHVALAKAIEKHQIEGQS